MIDFTCLNNGNFHYVSAAFEQKFLLSMGNLITEFPPCPYSFKITEEEKRNFHYGSCISESITWKFVLLVLFFLQETEKCDNKTTR